MSAFLRLLALCLFAWLGFAAPAHAAAHRTDWTCWLHTDSTRIACTVMRAMEAAEPAGAVALPRAVQAMNSRELMQAVRDEPSRTIGQLVFVPLHNIATDESMVQELVSAVLCGAKADCATHYHANLAQLIASAPELFADMTDPVLAGAQ